MSVLPVPTPAPPHEKRRHKRLATADLHYTPVRLDGVLLRRLEFICAYEAKDRSSVIRDLLREAADRHMRDIAGSPPAPSPKAAVETEAA
jgi:hypothetical protein